MVFLGKPAKPANQSTVFGGQPVPSGMIFDNGHFACCIRIGRDSMLYSVFFLLAPVAYATFSVRVADRHSGMVHTAHNHFPGAMKAEHVADLYARVSGKAPLLKEETVDLPSADILSAREMSPPILEVYGGNLEDMVASTEIARSDAARGPSLSNIRNVLEKNNIKTVAKTLDMNAGSENVDSTKDWIAQQTDPVIILHHDFVAAPKMTSRKMTSEYTNTTGLTEEQINDYQIFMWVFFGTFIFLLAAICMLTNMEVIPDSILFAKFQSARTNKIE